MRHNPSKARKRVNRGRWQVKPEHRPNRENKAQKLKALNREIVAKWDEENNA